MNEELRKMTNIALFSVRNMYSVQNIYFISVRYQSIHILFQFLEAKICIFDLRRKLASRLYFKTFRGGVYRGI